MKKDWEMRWLKEAKEQLLGKKIVDVRYMSQEEADDLDWTERPVVIHLDDGNLVFASADDEGNGAGALFTNNQANPVLPVLR